MRLIADYQAVLSHLHDPVDRQVTEEYVIRINTPTCCKQ
jgi:hypothetical protein